MSEFQDWGKEPPEETNEVNVETNARNSPPYLDMNKVAALMRGEEPSQNEISQAIDKNATTQANEESQKEKLGHADDNKRSTKLDLKQIYDFMTQDSDS